MLTIRAAARHPRAERLRHPVGAVEVDVDDLAELLGRLARRGHGGADAGVVDEHVGPAELGHRPLHDALAVLGLGHVGLDGDAAAAVGLDPLRVSSSRSARRAQMATSAPASARPSANATPRPEEAPVTIATLPSRRKRSRRFMARSVWKDPRSWHAPSRCSPASGPTCRSPSSPPSAASWGFDGLELACWGDHFDVDARARATPATAPSGASCSSATGSAAGRSATTSSARRSATRSTTRHQGDPAARGLGRRRPGGRARARRRAHEGHRARGRARSASQVVNGFTGSPIWHMLYSFPPNDFAEIERGYERVRRALGADHRRLRRRGRAVRARGAPDRDRLRLRRPRARRSPRSATGRASGSTSTRATSSTSSSTRPRSSTEFADRIYHVHVKDSIRRLDGRRSILGVAPQLRRGRPRLGLRLARPRRRRLRGALPRAQPRSATRARSRSSGRTPAWTASTAPRTRWRSCAGPTSPPRAWRSTPRSRATSRPG